MVGFICAVRIGRSRMFAGKGQAVGQRVATAPVEGDRRCCACVCVHMCSVCVCPCGSSARVCMCVCVVQIASTASVALGLSVRVRSEFCVCGSVCPCANAPFREIFGDACVSAHIVLRTCIVCAHVWVWVCTIGVRPLTPSFSGANSFTACVCDACAMCVRCVWYY